MRRLLALMVLLPLAAACGPAEVAGDYSVSVVNRENGCGFENWTEGETLTAVPLTVTQEGQDVTATVGGLVGALLDLSLGSRSFTGEVKGDQLALTLFGTRTASEGNCTYTMNAELEAESDGDLMQGEIRYTPATNGNPDCSAIDGCVTRQEFNGTRPPSE